MTADLKRWLLWMRRKDSSLTHSWEAWWVDEHGHFSTASWVKKGFILLPAVRYLLTAVGILSSLSLSAATAAVGPAGVLHAGEGGGVGGGLGGGGAAADGAAGQVAGAPAGLPTEAPARALPNGLGLHGGGLPAELRLLGATFGSLAAAAVAVLLLRRLLRHSYLALRVGSVFLIALCAAALLFVRIDLSLFQLVMMATACGYLVAALVRIPFTLGRMPRAAVLACQAYDYLCGALLLALCLLLSLGPTCRSLQTKALLSKAFNRGVRYNEISQLLAAGGASK